MIDYRSQLRVEGTPRTSLPEFVVSSAVRSFDGGQRCGDSRPAGSDHFFGAGGTARAAARSLRSGSADLQFQSIGKASPFDRVGAREKELQHSLGEFACKLG